MILQTCTYKLNTEYQDCIDLLRVLVFDFDSMLQGEDA